MATTPKSKVLVIGGTGYIGRRFALAGPPLGHPTFVLVRPPTLTSPTHAPLLTSFQSAGITLLQGSLDDYDSLLAALKQVDVVICAIRSNTLDQLKLIQAIKEVGTIKRFVPSEFGSDGGRAHALEAAQKYVYEPKLKIRKAVKEAGIPYTFVVSNGFAGYFLSNFLQTGLQSPPREKAIIYGSGDVNFVAVTEEDVAAYTMMAVDDPRTLNKTLHIRPPEDTLTMNSMVEMWEGMIGKTLEKTTVTEEEMVKQVEETPPPGNTLLALYHTAVFQGLHCFNLGPDDVEATALYPDHKYTTAKEYLKQFL